jgi:hypothetical protein
MSIYAVSDLHLSFAPSVDKPMDIYGPRWFNYTERLRDNWCATIKDSDTVIMPGDISWGLKLSEAEDDLAWIDQLPGRKVMLKGNHDLWWNGITKLNAMYETIHFLQYDGYRAEGLCICGSRGWLTPDNDDYKQADEKIYRRELLRMEASIKAATAMMEDGDELLGVMHFPPVAKAASFSGFQQLFEDYGIKRVIYGHVHGEEGFRNTIIGNYHNVNYSLVSVDYLNCKPLLIKE